MRWTSSMTTVGSPTPRSSVMTDALGSVSAASIVLLRLPEEDQPEGERHDGPPDAGDPVVLVIRMQVQDRAAHQVDVDRARVEVHDVLHECAVPVGDLVDVVEDTGEEQPGPKDERKDLRRVGDLGADPRHDHGEAERKRDAQDNRRQHEQPLGSRMLAGEQGHRYENDARDEELLYALSRCAQRQAGTGKLQGASQLEV